MGRRRQFCRSSWRRATNHAERVDAVCRLSNICEQWAFAAASSTAAVTNVANFVDIGVH
jgi:hypothetical protein